MRNDERNDLDRLIFGVQCDLDVILLPENVEAARGDINDIVTRCLRALERKEAA